MVVAHPTGTPEITPHHLLQTEAEPATGVLAAAFADDPMFTWMCPELSVPEREQALVGFFAPFVDASRRRGHAYATDDRASVALWSPPDVALLDDGALEALGQFFVEVIGERAELVGTALQEVEARHPTEPHFYLGAIGTRPELRGRGRGRVALGPVLERCDQTGVPAYLESSSIRNVPFYERLGFVVTDEVRLADGPVLRLMWREPRPPEQS
ncbi:MAG TPA: GNAT family N-acetyltransferase [Acidimicrobiales bacterium]|jgi:GNAT superfamily N-acetyltransferase|nr:GNAT family N-acetyltransferase [Acidimicrobiales bacterium]